MRFLHALILGLCVTPAAAAPSFPMSADQKKRLEAWYDALGAPRGSETFGHYLARAARVQHGVGYGVPAEAPGAETLQINLDAFECVSFIESSMAVARCGWSGEPDELCFTEDLEASRYRGGALGDYASRLHYFVDWIRRHLIAAKLRWFTHRAMKYPDHGVKGSRRARPTKKTPVYLSSRGESESFAKAAIDQEAIDAVTETLLATEQRLSSTSHDVLGRESAPEALRALEDGDLVAFVRERPGLLVHHAGFVYWANGTPRLLHASSYHERVVITESDLTDYLLRRPERKGVIIARPLAAQDVPGR